MILPGGGYGKGAKEGAKAVAKGVDKFSDTKKVANSTKQASTPGRRGAFRQAKKMLEYDKMCNQFHRTIN